MEKIFEIASQVSTPLALAGFFAALVFFIFRQIVAKNIFPRLTAAIGADLLKLIVDRLFVLALVAMVLGFVGYVVPPLFPPQGPQTGGTPPVNVGAVSNIVRSQIESRDYAAAWDTVTGALKSEPNQEALLDLQAEIAMHWIRDLHVTEPQKFGDVVDTLIPALYQAVQRRKESNKVEAANALAHIGWANFLKYREGGRNLEIDEKYRAALQLDPDNPFAHAMWGHWLLADGNHVAEAQARFAAALKGGRERPFVRNLQLAALQWGTTDKNTIELIRVCNEMRKNNESLDEERRSRLLSRIYFGSRDAVHAKLDEILPADEHLATVNWLAQGLDPSTGTTLILARLSEAVGDCHSALRLYVSLLWPGLVSEISSKVLEGIERCKRTSPQLKSEVEILSESLNDKSADVRRNAVDVLAALLATSGGKVDLKVMIPALRDPDKQVRHAAILGVARSGREAVPAMIELLGSPQAADQARAAEVLAEIGGDSKAAIPALLRVFRSSDDEAQGAALEALASIGLEARAAVAPITQMLSTRPSLERRKALVFALGAMGPASRPAVPLIIEALRDRSDSSGLLNEFAVMALGKIGPAAAAAVPALIVALESGDDISIRLVMEATDALGNIGAEAKAAIPALVEAMGDREPEYKKNQAEAIGKIAQALAVRRDRSSVKALRAALRAEEQAGLGVETIAPLREAIDDLRTS